MKAQVKTKQVVKDIPRYPADSFLCDAGENGVSQFLENGRADSGGAI